MSNKVYEFNSSNKIGHQGEQFVKQWILDLHPNVASITDVSEDKFYQRQDIDFVVDFINGKQATVEIKTDTYKTGNMFFETISNEEYQTKGCLMKTNADFLFYYFSNYQNGVLYIFKMKAFRKFVLDNLPHFRQRRVTNTTHTSIGYIVPLSYIENNFSGYKKYSV